MKVNDWDKLVDGVKTGDVRSLSRMITRVENRADGWKKAMQQLYSSAGRAKVVGITGSPGAGKSTLVNALAGALSKRGKTVGIIAVDPSSPFSGGALLGDRLRMADVAVNPDIFIRSMATRGALGGLCQGARDVARILDAFGKDVVLIETVGVGQDEIEVVKTADCVLVVCVPGQGDGIQALKAGIMEIADIYVVNKADRPGADEVVADIEGMLSIADQGKDVSAPVVKTAAATGAGVDDLCDKLFERLDHAKNKEQWLEKRVREEILSLVETQIMESLLSAWQESG
ncbi:MAG: methylmalonyl Co-A mutase-associated GTPase MeaB, partial [Desulfatibacillaceae bacterium]|nr:methylmalonyl Co-A mutase-associated GTPase MeaB [Desulfatibacillaceae bacterium]